MTLLNTYRLLANCFLSLCCQGAIPHPPPPTPRPDYLVHNGTWTKEVFSKYLPDYIQSLIVNLVNSSFCFRFSFHKSLLTQEVYIVLSRGSAPCIPRRLSLIFINRFLQYIYKCVQSFRETFRLLMARGTFGVFVRDTETETCFEIFIKKLPGDRSRSRS